MDEWKRHRDATDFERRGNRNPFLDHPALAETLLADLSSFHEDLR